MEALLIILGLLVVLLAVIIIRTLRYSQKGAKGRGKGGKLR